MEKKKYKKLKSELTDCISHDELVESIAEPLQMKRIGLIMDLMRRAVMKSSLGMYGGSPHYFSGKIYEPFKDCDFRNVIYDILNEAHLERADFTKIGNIIGTARSAMYSKDIRPDSQLMVFKNVVYDISRRREFRFHKRYVQVTKVDYEFNSRDFPMMWTNFLNQVLPDENYQKILQEFLGSIFVDRRKAKLETMLILKGSGSNGKSVVFETILGVLGRQNVSNFGLSALISGSERKKNIATINGKRLNYCSEIRATEISGDSDMLKSLISGEPLDARAMYGDNFMAYDIPLMMANANSLPVLRDWSYGMKRRLLVIPFDVEIPPERQNKRLSAALASEYPAIFNWMMEGRDRFIANGYKLTKSDKLDRIINEYFSECSSALKFMDYKGYARCQDKTYAEPKWVSTASVFREYCNWCNQNTVQPYTAIAFGRALQQSGYKRRMLNGKAQIAIFGETVLLRNKRKTENEE